MSSDAEEYVHDPAEFDGDGDRDTGESTDPGATGEAGPSADPDREFGTRGWVLVGVLVVCFFVIPAVIIARPPALPFEVAFLVLPLLPAALLGATAVWTLAARNE